MITKPIPGYGWLIARHCHGFWYAVLSPAPAFYRVTIGGGVLIEEVL